MSASPPQDRQGELTAARAALRERQGAGARYDAAGAPVLELAWARLGTAYFARRLNELRDDELHVASGLPGWTRAELVAHVGYNARALTRLTEWARTGVVTPMYASAEQRSREILLGGTLPTRALRNLFDHAVVHLDVEWRDLTSEQWDAEVVTAQGRAVSVRETAWMRAREVWVHAIDLGTRGAFRDFPPELVRRLIADVVSAWGRRGEGVSLLLEFTDGAPNIKVEGPQGQLATGVSGASADIARWLTGRGASGLTVVGGGELPSLPRWF